MKFSRVRNCIIPMFDNWTKCKYYVKKIEGYSGYCRCKYYIPDLDEKFSNGACVCFCDKQIKDEEYLEDDLFKI